MRADPRPVRVRFAPSPTGYFHVGGAKTALYNWIFARQLGGVFVLRIEDTDLERNRAEWTQGIQDALRWIGIDWDEGPYFQSERSGAHVAAANRLFRAGNAYYCDCTREAVDARNKEAGHGRTGYDRHCRDRGLEPAEGRALRFRVPPGSTTVIDLIRGTPTFDNATIEDFVVLRGNGTPIFHLANVVDDIDMGITHVIRAEEHLPNTPKQQLLWAALSELPLPTFAHVPLLVNEKRQKLSKRRDPVALEGYRDEGYLADAMRNFLMCLGWSPPGEDEIVSWETIMTTFRLEDVQSSPAYFDVVKLKAFNQEYLKALSPAAFVEACQPWLLGSEVPWPPERYRPEWFEVMAPLLPSRIHTLGEVPGLVDFLFTDGVTIDDAVFAKHLKPALAPFVDAVIEAYEHVEWTAAELKATLEGVGERLAVKKAQVPIRVAVTGKAQGAPLYEPLELLGRAAVLERLRAARSRMAG